ncbi:(d)CMP kinase [Kaustia mangrovi]|uniref:Cytidylate kinase n=1 Tax=Kaustia mangrovi TaxID=2593653 RepID=A0A7S8C381_9HYPH|nr:(d)CMP kinase [Kaustia mangrovi]QPC42574.1 (d)CMP kinase [Kaustia mangrovi]
MIIAVDGPAASGKGTLARRLAAHYGLAYLDTGSLYRAVALAVLRAGGDPADEAAAVAAAHALDMADTEDPALRGSDVGRAASVVAAMPAVREAILDRQRRFAHTPPGAVLDGRDIATVVCPDAEVKLFVTASDEVRAMRRCKELEAAGEAVGYDAVLRDLVERDARDRNRTHAPLRQADDAYLLDTSNLDIEAAFRAAVGIVDSYRETGGVRP